MDIKDLFKLMSDRIDEMTPDELLEHHHQAQRMMEDPIYFIPDGTPVKGELARNEEPKNKKKNKKGKNNDKK